MTVMNSLMITEADIAEYQGDAQDYLKTARQRVSLASRSGGTFVGSQSASDEVSLLALVTAIDPKDELLSDAQLHTLRAIRRGLQIGFRMAEQYRQRSGAASFESAHGLSDSQKAELNEKMQTAAAIAVFSAARYILWDMKGLSENNSFVGNIPADFEKVDISTPRSAVMCLMYYLGKHVEKEVNGSDDRLVAAVIGFAQVAELAILNRQTGLKHTDAFIGVSYTLEETDFSISGFDSIDLTGTASVAFNRVDMGEIVGNADAKHFARRQAQRLVCYNREAGKNVFSELGGLSPVFMGYGKPGTGKSMMIGATSTLLHDYCEVLGHKYRFHPLPDNLVDSYQGNSAKNMVTWFTPLRDPDYITFAPIDDAENNFEDRDRKGVSEGVKAIIGVFLRMTEGAYAINRGNAAIGMFTNLADIIDPAVRSRIQGRMVIDGADSVEDYLDQNWLMLRDYSEQAGFFDLIQPVGYERMSAQKQLKSIADAEQTRDIPEQPRARSVFDSVVRDFDVQSEDFFAQLSMGFMDVFPGFSSRDVRNIQSAVKQRIMDFDMPEEWFENPETFCGLSYDEQMAMVISLRDENLKGLSLSGIMLQEYVRYLDNYELIADRSFKRQVDDEVERRRVLAEVQKVIAQG